MIYVNNKNKGKCKGGFFTMQKEKKYIPNYANKSWEELSTEEQEDFMMNFRNEIQYYKNYTNIVSKWLDKMISDYEIKVEKNRYKIEQKQKNKSLSKLFQLNESLVIKLKQDGYKITEYVYHFGEQMPAATTVLEVNSDQGQKLIRFFENKASEEEVKSIQDYVDTNSSYKMNFKSIFDRIMLYLGGK